MSTDDVVTPSSEGPTVPVAAVINKLQQRLTQLGTENVVLECRVEQLEAQLSALQGVNGSD